MRASFGVPGHCSMNSIGYLWHLGLSSKLQPSPTKSLTWAYQLSQYHPARELRTSSSNLLAQPYSKLILASFLFNQMHPKFGTNCPLKSSLHTHSRLLRAGLKLTIPKNHLPRSLASPHLKFVPYCSSELAVLDPGVYKSSLLLLLLILLFFFFFFFFLNHGISLQDV